MARLVEDRAHAARLHDAAGIHHQHAVAEAGNDAKVVRDEDDRHAEFMLQAPDELKNLRLHGHVERRGGLVGDQQLRPRDEGRGNHHALAHAAGEFVRIVMEAFRGVVDADGLQHLLAAPQRRGLRDFLMDDEGLDELFGNA